MCSCSSLQSRRASWTVGDGSIVGGCKVIAGCCINRVNHLSVTIQARTVTLWYLVNDSDRVDYVTQLKGHIFYIPVHVGLVLQLPLAKQDTAGDPDRMYPLLQL